eukprot:GCRY01000453.1.p1 GENE.GCRY01000453.1~~GCRY01000453.1.p1  ORF type:complete len:372 (+),score=105.59 GCRY01000453.1:109-1224(+)
MEYDHEEFDKNISDADVLTKYKTAAGIANDAMTGVIAAVKADIDVVELCQLGDKLINEACSKIYNKKVKGREITKGIAFPTCVSVNDCVGHFSPFSNESVKLAEGDMVKIDLGVHVDGRISQIAHTVVVGAGPIKERNADVVMAANQAANVVLHMMKPGVKNNDISAMIEKVAKCYNCTPVEGVLSHETKAFVLDHENVIINKPSVDQKVEEFEIEPYSVFTIDVVMTTGEGKAIEKEARTTVFKRTENSYSLKMKASRAVLHEIESKFSTMAFSLRSLEEKNARMGIVECLNHGLVQPFPVLFEKSGANVAQVKFTVLVTPTSTMRVTEAPLPELETECVLDEELKAILATSLKRNSKKKKKAAKKEATN